MVSLQEEGILRYCLIGFIRLESLGSVFMLWLLILCQSFSFYGLILVLINGIEDYFSSLTTQMN